MAANTFLLGRHVACAITPALVDPNTGVWSNSTSRTLVGKLERASVTVNTVTVEISPMDAIQEHYEWIRDGATVELSEILRSDALSGSNNLLKVWEMRLSTGHRHATVTITRGNNTWTFYGLIQSYSEGLVDSKNVGTMNLQIVNQTGVVNATPGISAN